MKKDNFAAPLKTAKGYGSAHEGVDHWMKQKITAIANIPLIIWLVYSIVDLQGATHVQFTNWLAQPLNAILMIFLVISVMIHAKLGAQVIVEDYISCKVLRMAKLIAHKILFTGIAITMIFCILKIAFTAGV